MCSYIFFLLETDKKCWHEKVLGWTSIFCFTCDRKNLSVFSSWCCNYQVGPANSNPPKLYEFLLAWFSLIFELSILKYWGNYLQVNEYPSGVGLSPHIDTHSAFEDKIFSLSLAGPCIMEFRRYQGGNWPSNPAIMHEDNLENFANVSRRSLYLPPRSMLLISGEARYAWHHYIPHHKVSNILPSSTFLLDFHFRICCHMEFGVIILVYTFVLL